MLSSIRTAAVSAIQRQINRFFPPAAPQLAGFPLGSLESSVEGSNNAIEESIWFAVPKSKVSRGKKRMKTTLQKRIKLKDNIVIGEYYLRRIQLALENPVAHISSSISILADKRTGELTLKHKLPYNWKNYLPENAEYAP